MILVDIYTAGTETKHDFWLEEQACIADLTEEIGAMLSRQESSQEENMGDFVLCSYEKQQILPADRTLAECGITNGSRLLFL